MMDGDFYQVVLIDYQYHYSYGKYMSVEIQTSEKKT